MPKVKITKRALDAMTPGDTAETWFDTEVKGFGVRVMPSGTATYIFEYRPGGGGRTVSKRRLKLARVGEITPDEARTKAIRHHRAVLDGGDPAGALKERREAPTLAELGAEWIEQEITPKKKPATTALYRIYLDKHVTPRIGTTKAGAVTFAALAKVHREIGKEKAVTANRILNALSGLYTWAQKTKRLPENFNPAKGHDRFRETAKERFLSSEELARLGEAIREAETVGIGWKVDRTKARGKHIVKDENARTIIEPSAAAAIRLLLFTGARLREILHLRWTEVDFERGLLLLDDSKTGKKTVVLNAPALAVLASISRLGLYVIKGDQPDAGQPEKPRADLKRPWTLVTKRADLEGLRIHDLRHSFASFGAAGGMGLPILGKLLGHKSTATTEKYAHLADDPLRRASDAIGGKIAAIMGEESRPGATITPIKRGRA